jgi:hypothetical protein
MKRISSLGTVITIFFLGACSQVAPRSETQGAAESAQQWLCVPSTASPGKFFLASIADTAHRYSNYFDSAADCTKSARVARGNRACMPSDSVAGKTFIGELATGDEVRLSNYYDGLPSCLSAIAASHDGNACMVSDSRPGKAFIGRLTSGNEVRLSDYYDDLGTCVDVYDAAGTDIVCMPSEAQAGKWFLAHLTSDDSSVMAIGGYLESKALCLEVQPERRHEHQDHRDGDPDDPRP